MQATPLAPTVLRVLPADTYRLLAGLVDSKAHEIETASRRAGPEPAVFLVSFYGMVGGARFNPNDVSIMSFTGFTRPGEIIPLTPDWSRERLDVREVQRAIYVFDAPVNVLEPFTFTYGAISNDTWAQRTRTIQDELSRARGRAAADGN